MAHSTESRVYTVLAASTTRRERGSVDLLVRTDVAGCTLRFPLALADGLLVIPRLPGEFFTLRHPRKPRTSTGRSLSPEVRQSYLAAFIDWKSQPNLKQAEACRRHGITQANFSSWTSAHRDECEAAYAATRAPLAKPGGSLL